MKKIDLNCDMGETLSGQSENIDLDIMPYISSCNIACGFHSGSPKIIENTIRNAVINRLKIGAHPSYDDRVNFGRQSVQISVSELLPQLRYQICAVKGMVESLGGTLNHVKPHGALYNDMVRDDELAKAFVVLVKEIDPSLQIFGLAESTLSKFCRDYNMVFINEGFADRKYQNKTQLRNRNQSGAVLLDENEILNQIELITNGAVELHSGEVVNINVDSICLHSDTPSAVRLSKIIHDFIQSKNIIIG